MLPLTFTLFSLKRIGTRICSGTVEPYAPRSIYKRLGLRNQNVIMFIFNYYNAPELRI